ncbi:MAG: hypothetical protein ABIW50_00395, partial [Candidatus Limnocylindria bacterium]
MSRNAPSLRLIALWAAIALLMTAVTPVAANDPPADGLEPIDPSGPMEEHDAQVEGIVSSGPNAKVTKNLAIAGRGVRLLPGATTDVWTLNKYTYIG